MPTRRKFLEKSTQLAAGALATGGGFHPRCPVSATASTREEAAEHSHEKLLGNG